MFLISPKTHFQQDLNLQLDNASTPPPNTSTTNLNANARITATKSRIVNIPSLQKSNEELHAAPLHLKAPQ
jgi:hypothetical protein